MDTKKVIGRAVSAERSTHETIMGEVHHSSKEHEFCNQCGMCRDCGDCLIWGCGK